MSLERVTESPDYVRIASLPARMWDMQAANDMTTWLTSQLRTADAAGRPMHVPSGLPHTLRALQALMLADAYQIKGLFAPVGVGEGKTLTSFLLPTVLNAVRPLLLQPAALVE